MEFNPKKKVWTEKYRPKKVSDMVGDFKDKILKHLQDFNSMQHLLLYSKTPGTGKTTLAKAIINEVGADALVLNSSDDRKIDVIRDKVKEFSITQSSQVGKRRIVFLDEFDGMLKASQEALRNIMETYTSNVLFILTCNNINKVIEPLQSRCLKIAFAYPEKDQIAIYLANICKTEEMEYTQEGLLTLIEMHYPSIRNCVIALQDLYTEAKSVIKENVKPVNQMFDDLYKLLMDKNWHEIKKIVLSSTVNPRELNNFFWIKGLETDNTKLIQITCRNEKDIAWGADAKIIFVTSLIEMVK